MKIDSTDWRQRQISYPASPSLPRQIRYCHPVGVSTGAFVVRVGCFGKRVRAVISTLFRVSLKLIVE